MKLNSESILKLDANKAYYIANSTGEIKEAGLWQRFKFCDFFKFCLFFHVFLNYFTHSTR